MKKLAVLIMLGLPACAADHVQYEEELTEQQVEAMGQQPIIFSAESNGSPVSARCSISGSAVNIAFTTPSKIAIPHYYNSTEISEITCNYNGETLTTQTLPSRETGLVLADFTNSRAEFWFKRHNGGVLYYTRGDVVVRVSGAP